MRRANSTPNTGLREPTELDRARMRSRPAVSGPQPDPADTLVILRRDELNSLFAAAAATQLDRENDGDEAVLTRQEVAKMLKKSGKSISSLVKHSGMPCKMLGKEYRFIKADVLGWMRALDSGMTGRETE